MELKVNGTTLHAEVVGDGAPCLVPHGGPGTDSAGLIRSFGPLAGPLGLRMIFWDHRGHGRSEWVPIEQCTQDQLVADVEGVRGAPGLGPVHVLGISWGGFLGLMYAARHASAIRRLTVVGASASHEFRPRAEANARRRATPEQWGAYRALWDGTLSDDASLGAPSRRSGPSTSTTKPWRRLPTRRAPTRGIEWRHGRSSSSTSTRHTTAVPSSRGSTARPSSWSDVTTGLPRRSGGGDPQAGLALGAHGLRGKWPLAAGRGAGGLHAAARHLSRRVVSSPARPPLRPDHDGERPVPERVSERAGRARWGCRPDPR